MRHIAALSHERVPRDDEFKFRERAKVLVDKWHQILGSNKPNGTENAANGDGGADPHEAVTEGTAAIDLNGKPEGEAMCFLPPAFYLTLVLLVPAAKADETLGEVTMSEA